MITSSRRVLAGAVLVLGVTALAACASGDNPGGPSPSTSPIPTSAPTSPARKVITLQGTVGAGVESGCTILTAGDTVYELQGTVARSLRPGTVTVTGYVLHGVLTFCQQGTPFHVVEVQPE
jgi:hypothetical protein